MAGMPQEQHAIMVNVTKTCVLQAFYRPHIIMELYGTFFILQRRLAVRILSKKIIQKGVRKNVKRHFFFAKFNFLQNRPFSFAMCSPKTDQKNKKLYTGTFYMERRNFLSSQIFFKMHYYSRIYAKHFQRFPIFWKFGNLSVLFLTNLPPKGSEK